MASEPAPLTESYTGSWWSSNSVRLLTRGQGRRAAMVVTLLLAVFDVWLGERYWSPVRYRIFDAYQRVFPRQPQRRPVVVVDIDEASLAKLGQWPWPRTRLARLIDATSHLGALAVGLDMIMPEPDRLSPSVLIDDRPDLHPALRAELAMLPSNDAILAETLHRVSSVIGRVGMSAGENAGRPSSGQTPVRVHGDLSIAHVQTYYRHLSNVSAIEEAASGRGYLNDARDTDGVVRAMPLLVVVNGELAPTFALELLRVAAGEPFYNVYGGPQGVGGVQIGTSFIPTDPDGRIRLYYARPDSTDRRRRISALAILNREVEANALANQVAIIGVTGVGITDVVATPVAALMEGVEVQAQAIENILDGTRLVRPLLAPWLELGLFLSVAAVQIAFVPRLRPASGVVVFIMSAGIFTTACLMSFVLWKVLLDPSFAAAGNAVILGVLLAVAYAAVEWTRRWLEHAFCHYLSPAIVDQLARDPSALRLGGERREITVMFADLSGFTELSGKVEPELLVRATNQYLGYIVEQVEATGGYVDKFIGDAVMALWGAPVADPQHAVNGVRAAMAAVLRIRQAQKASLSQREFSFSVKIGLNSGPAVAGNVGTDKRYNYTAVGETINIASRLESVPSHYACQIVLGPRTAELVESKFLLRQLDTIQVKGREAPLVVFEPLAEQERATPEQREHARRFAEALTHYRAMRFAEAWLLWDALVREERDGMSCLPTNPSSEMAARARAFMTHPPTHPWNGVWVLPSK